MKRTDKEQLVTELTSKIKGAQALYYTDFTGLNVKRMTDLRRRLRKAGVEYVVIKNTLALRAVNESGLVGERLKGPTGIVVACQNERSQHKNRASAFKQLKARLYEAELQKREAEANAANAAKTDIGWGHQIRSYVLQPYQLVKDLRTGVTSTAPSDVLDGDLDRFMAAALSQRVTGETVEVEDVD